VSEDRADTDVVSRSKGPLTVRSRRDTTDDVITVSGELDLAGVDLLDEETRRVAAENGRRIVLDLSGLEFIDATGIHLLLDLASRARRNGNPVFLAHRSDAVQRMLDLTGANHVMVCP
jgi:anti-sigma B factor antagonist